MYFKIRRPLCDMSFHFAHFSSNFPSNIHLLWHVFFFLWNPKSNTQNALLFTSWCSGPHALDGRVCAPLNIILSTTEYSSARIFFFSCPLMFWFIKTVVTKLIPFKTYLCVMFFSFASCLGTLREISDVLTECTGNQIARSLDLREHPRQVFH